MFIGVHLWLIMVLFVAAEAREFAGLVRRATHVERFACPVSWSRRANLNGAGILMVANGAGPQHAAAAVEAALAAADIHAIVSTGFCGALDPALSLAAVFVATSINGTPAATPRSARPHHTGALISIDHVASTAEEKSSLRGTGASAVEMEAAGVAERAKAHQLPFYCIRAVTDLAGETFGIDFNAALRPDGHFATMQILRSTIGRPSLIPELLRLRRRCAIAAQALGEFLADCRF